MAVQLSPQLEDRIERLVASGRFSDADDLVERALIALETDDPAFWAWVAEVDARAGDPSGEVRTTPFDDEIVDRLQAIVTRDR